MGLEAGSLESSFLKLITVGWKVLSKIDIVSYCEVCREANFSLFFVNHSLALVQVGLGPWSRGWLQLALWIHDAPSSTFILWNSSSDVS